MASRFCFKRYMSYQVKGGSLNPKIAKYEGKRKEITVPYEFSLRQVYHIRGRYGKYFWAVVASGIFLGITVLPTYLARDYGNKKIAEKLLQDPSLLDGVKKEHLPPGVVKHLKNMDSNNNSDDIK